MKYQNQPIAATYRRFRALAGKLRKLIDRDTFSQLDEKEQAALLSRLRQLYHQLSRVIAGRKLKTAIASGALLMSLGLGNASAQTFGPPQVSPFNLEATTQAYFRPQFADIDTDGDLDILAVGYVEYQGNAVYFFENVGTADAPDFAAPVANPFGLVPEESMTTLSAIDLDKDGDLDLMIGKYDGSNIYYFENSGNPTTPIFAAATIDPFNIQSSGSFAIPVLLDLDDDGDLDLLVGNYYYSYGSGTEGAFFQYQENIGTPTAPDFGAVQENPFGLMTTNEYAIQPNAVDIDMDGDLDLLNGGNTSIDLGNDSYRAYVTFIENTGTPGAPSFGSIEDEPFGIVFPDFTYSAFTAMADLDNDGDADLISFTYVYDENAYDGTNAFIYFENQSMISSTSQEVSHAAPFTVYPTTAQEFVNWQLDQRQITEPVQLHVSNSNGQIVQQLNVQNPQGVIDLKNWASGMYVVQLRDQHGKLLDMAHIIKP
jgi:hypothetical protein